LLIPNRPKGAPRNKAVSRATKSPRSPRTLTLALGLMANWPDVTPTESTPTPVAPESSTIGSARAWGHAPIRRVIKKTKKQLMRFMATFFPQYGSVDCQEHASAPDGKAISAIATVPALAYTASREWTLPKGEAAPPSPPRGIKVRLR